MLQVVHLFGDGQEAVLCKAHDCLSSLVRALEEADKKEDEKAPAGMLTYAHVCSRMLTYAHVCSRMLTYADVC